MITFDEEPPPNVIGDPVRCFIKHAEWGRVESRVHVNASKKLQRYIDGCISEAVALATGTPIQHVSDPVHAAVQERSHKLL